jgi:hypothetical protein
MLATYSNFLKDFETTFPNGPRADIIDVENFIKKYKLLIERTTNTFIEDLNMFECVDFGKRIQMCFYASQIAKSKIINFIEE